MKKLSKEEMKAIRSMLGEDAVVSILANDENDMILVTDSKRSYLPVNVPLMGTTSNMTVRNQNRDFFSRSIAEMVNRINTWGDDDFVLGNEEDGFILAEEYVESEYPIVPAAVYEERERNYLMFKIKNSKNSNLLEENKDKFSSNVYQYLKSFL